MKNRAENNLKIEQSDIRKLKYEKQEFLETLLLFRGWFSRQDLKSVFDTAPAVATREIKKYRELLVDPDGVYLDNSSKLYRLNEEKYQPVFARTSNIALSFLRRMASSDVLGGYENISVETFNRPVRNNVDIIARMTRAIFAKETVNIEYVSSREGIQERTITPHALFDGGFQWYARCFQQDNSSGAFSDIALSRIKKISHSRDKIDSDLNKFDEQWNNLITLDLVAHPDLKHPESIQFQYDMNNGIKSVNIRSAIAGYLLSHWNVDCSKKHTLDPKRFQLYLDNRDVLLGVKSAEIAPGYL